MPLIPRLAAAALLAMVSVARSAPARAQETCVTAYESAQELRRARELLRSRAELRLCERACPKALAEQCSGWRREVEAELASVVLSVTDADGRAVVKVRVTAGGARLADEISGSALELDPGPHTLVFEDGAGARAEAVVELAAGEKQRAISVRFPPAPRPSPAPPKDPPAPPASRSPLAYLLGGVGLGGLAAGAGLGIKGQIDKARLEGSCAPGCDKKTQVDPIAAEWWAGVASAVAGGALFATGAVVWAIEGRTPARSAVRVTVVPSPGGAIVIGRF